VRGASLFLGEGNAGLLPAAKFRIGRRKGGIRDSSRGLFATCEGEVRHQWAGR